MKLDAAASTFASCKYVCQLQARSPGRARVACSRAIAESTWCNRSVIARVDACSPASADVGRHEPVGSSSSANYRDRLRALCKTLVELCSDGMFEACALQARVRCWSTSCRNYSERTQATDAARPHAGRLLAPMTGAMRTDERTGSPAGAPRTDTAHSQAVATQGCCLHPAACKWGLASVAVRASAPCCLLACACAYWAQVRTGSVEFRPVFPRRPGAHLCEPMNVPWRRIVVAVPH